MELGRGARGLCSQLHAHALYSQPAVTSEQRLYVCQCWLQLFQIRETILLRVHHEGLTWYVEL